MRLRPLRIAVVTSAVIGVTLFGCQMVAGVDFDSAHPALPDESGTTSPTSFGDEGGVGNGADGGNVSVCTPEPNSITCADKCTTTNDNCNTPRACSTNCGEGKECVSGKCECVSNGNWCAFRCGSTRDNCNRPVNCGGCDAGVTCNVQNSCGCIPDPPSVACGSKTCGTATNNCGQLVACGSGQCTQVGAFCKPDGTCCIDDNQACNGRCGGVSVKNNCGQDVGCPAGCATGQVCNGTNCCTPEPLDVTCAGTACGPKTNNCGQVVTCPNTCVAPQTCGGGGMGPNGCGCTPQTTDPCRTKCAGTATNNCGTVFNCNTSCFEVCPCAGGTCNQVSGNCSCRPPPCL